MDSASKRTAVVGETGVGTIPTAPAFKTVRDIRVSGSPQRNASRSPERRSDRMAANMVTGLNSYPKTIELPWVRDDALDVIWESALCGAWSSNILQNASVQKTFTLEEKYEGGATDPYRRLAGCQVDQVSIGFQNGQAGSISFGVRALDETTDTAILGSATYAAVSPGYDPVTPADISVNDLFDIDNPKVLALSLTITNNLREQYSWGSANPYGLGMGLFSVEGTVDIYFTRLADYSTFTTRRSNRTLDLTIGSATNGKDRLVIPNCDVWNPDVGDPGAAGDHIVTLRFTAKYYATDTAAIKLRRGAAAEITPYLGFVATRGHKPYTANSLGGTNLSMTRSYHYARDTITALQVMFANWSADELAPGSTATVKASIEYPLGTMTPLLFSASATGTIPNGGQLLSDSLTITIPNGAKFYVRNYFSSASKIVFTDGSDTANGDAMEYASSGITDKTAGGTVGNTDGNNYNPPIAILGMTTKPSVLICGDSRVHGQGDAVTDGSGNLGSIARSIGPAFGYIKVAKPGETFQGFIGASTNRRALAAYCSHIVECYGINDVNNGRTGAEVVADLEQFAALFPTKKVFALTVEPYTTGAWTLADGSDQTISAGNTARAYLNAYLRAESSPLLTGYFDLAAVNESGTTGKWVAPGRTNDGLHLTYAAYVASVSSGAIDTTQITYNG